MCLTALLKGAVCCSGCERWAMKHCFLHWSLSNAECSFHGGQLDPLPSLKARNVIDGIMHIIIWNILRQYVLGEEFSGEKPKFNLLMNKI